MAIKSKGREPRVEPSSPPDKTAVPPPKSTAPVLPVQIPKPKKEASRPPKRHARRPTRLRDPGAVPPSVPPSVHALLASTTIPRPKGSRTNRSSAKERRAPEKEKDSDLDAELWSQPVPEADLSPPLGRSPLDVLLSAPEDPDDDDDDDDSTSFSDSFLSLASGRTVSVESMPSLAACSSPLCASLTDDSPPYRRRRSSLFVSRRSLEPVSLSPDSGVEAHPLSAEFTPDEPDALPPPDDTVSRWDAFAALPLRSAFKSNLTASLRALASAARSFSSLSLASTTPDDLLARSILALDPGVPLADERRPPVLEDEPSAALRRYLNPTTRSRVEDAAPGPRGHVPPIQMQTYKVERLRENARAARLPAAVTPRTPAPGAAAVRREVPAPVMRQREMRENPDFIRVAVLEMAMRKRGKLDDSRPGRARWALPARRAAAREYEVGVDGVPVRWVPVEG